MFSSLSKNKRVVLVWNGFVLLGWILNPQSSILSHPQCWCGAPSSSVKGEGRCGRQGRHRWFGQTYQEPFSLHHMDRNERVFAL